jgi:hypothetical protein
MLKTKGPMKIQQPGREKSAGGGGTGGGYFTKKEVKVTRPAI